MEDLRFRRPDSTRSHKRGASSFSSDQALISSLCSVVNPPGVNNKALVGVTGSFVLMTEVVWGTLGDYFAGYKIINALRERNPGMQITWLILDKHNGVPKEVTRANNVYIFKDWDHIFTFDQPVLKILQKCHAILQFPTFHFLEDSAKKTLARLCRPSVTPVECLEYDYNSTSLANPNVISAGLGKDKLGIFLDDFGDMMMADRLVILPDHLKKLFGLSEIDNKTYLTNHALFVGYRNKDERSVVSKEVNIPNFVHTIAELSLLDAAVKDKKVVDIVVPILPTEEAQLDRARLANCGFQKIIFIDNTGAERVVDLNANGTKTLRIINPFRLDNAHLKILIASAHPFLLCTGDQSLSEVISKNNPRQGFVGLPFYQTMRWKTELFLALRMRTKQVCGDGSALDRFFTLITKIFDPKELAGVLCEPELHQDMLKLYLYIAQHKNLYNNLPSYIEQLMLQNGALSALEMAQAAELVAGDMTDEVVEEMTKEVVFEVLFGQLTGCDRIEENIAEYANFDKTLREIFDSYLTHTNQSFDDIIYTKLLEKCPDNKVDEMNFNGGTLFELYEKHGHHYSKYQLSQELSIINPSYNRHENHSHSFFNIPFQKQSYKDLLKYQPGYNPMDLIIMLQPKLKLIQSPVAWEYLIKAQDSDDESSDEENSATKSPPPGY